MRPVITNTNRYPVIHYNSSLLLHIGALLLLGDLFLFTAHARYSDTGHHQFKFEITEENHGTWLAEMIKLNSSKYVRPVKNQSSTVNVEFRLNLYQILGADAVNQHIHLHFWAEMKWFNEFIFWNPGDFGDIDRLDFESKYMWIPDIMFFNQLSDEHFNEHFPAPPSIYHSGEILVLKPFRVELQCRLEVLHFPFDRQHCEFEVGSWAHFSHQISLLPKRDIDTNEIRAADLQFFQNSSIFELDSFSVSEYNYSDPEFGAFMFNGLRYVIKFHRYTAYFVINLIMPSFMINVLCIFNFMIPCSSGEKAGYGITVFLAQSVNLMVVMEMMPQGGVSILGMFLAVSIALIGLSLLMNIITLRVYSPQDATVPPSIRLRKLGKFLQLLVGPREIPSDIVLSQKNFFKLSETFFEALSVDDVGFNPQPSTYDEVTLNNTENTYVAPKFFENHRETNVDFDASTVTQHHDEITIRSPYIPVNQQNGIKPGSKVKSMDPEILSPNRNGTELQNRVFHPNNNHYSGHIVNSSSMNNVHDSMNADPRHRKPRVQLPVTNEFLNSRIPLPGYGTRRYVEEPSTSARSHQAFESLENDTNRNEKTHNYTAEYQFLAETINRFNAIIFSALLMLTCGLYWIYHDPTSFANNYGSK
ncbi:neuronal acetylcholine receptor subunit alpha-2-like isoform X2 [Convolutriloba macropyga]|uniref:neuronal acetylcholine receptor subunit alpha-2-like isoform X2 n=1 Tax=Convolutriloba macropyga TaxID=536237 RepID=UPI003F51CF3B